jgi:hypothetical protein
MSEEATQGVLLRGKDGHQFFIPDSDFSKYAVTESGETGGDVASAPRVTAFAVQKTEGAEPAAAVFMPMTEGSAAFMPMPEG